MSKQVHRVLNEITGVAEGTWFNMSSIGVKQISPVGSALRRMTPGSLTGVVCAVDRFVATATKYVKDAGHPDIVTAQVVRVGIAKFFNLKITPQLAGRLCKNYSFGNYVKSNFPEYVEKHTRDDRAMIVFDNAQRSLQNIDCAQPSDTNLAFVYYAAIGILQ